MNRHHFMLGHVRPPGPASCHLARPLLALGLRAVRWVTCPPWAARAPPAWASHAGPTVGCRAWAAPPRALRPAGPPGRLATPCWAGRWPPHLGRHALGCWALCGCGLFFFFLLSLLFYLIWLKFVNPY